MEFASGLTSVLVENILLAKLCKWTKQLTSSPLCDGAVDKNTYLCYSPGERSILEKTVPKVLHTASWPWVVCKTEGTVFPNTDQPRLVNNIFISFRNTPQYLQKTQVSLCCSHAKKLKNLERRY